MRSLDLLRKDAGLAFVAGLSLACAGACGSSEPGPSPGVTSARPAETAVSSAAPPAQATVLASGQKDITALVVVGPDLYWTSAGLGGIYRVSKTGGAVEPVAVGLASPRALAVSKRDLFFLTLDGEGAKRGSIVRLSLDDRKPVVIASDQREPRALAVDESHVYWANSWVDPGGPGSFEGHNVGEVARAPRAGGRPTTLAKTGSPAAIAVLDGAVYVGCNDYNDRSIRRIEGGKAEEVALANPVVLAAYDGALYWTDDRGYVSRLKGGSVETLLEPEATTRRSQKSERGHRVLFVRAPALSSLAVLPSGIFLLDRGLPSDSMGGVWMLPWGSKRPVELVWNQERPPVLAVDEEAVYWATGAGDVMRMAR